MADFQIQRLKPYDREAARRMFAVMAAVFSETCSDLSDEYIDGLLESENFWAIAAFVRDEIIGGLTAHTLPMTTAARSEVFIYDLAVIGPMQRKGFGRRLVDHLCKSAAEAGIHTVFVPAENQDDEALEFYRAIGGTPDNVTFFTFETDPKPAKTLK